ncbi:MAG: MBL fold metallo-hydrolase [Clostridia bacterium]|nr:MBL fold metallo-hydrolase [Clostridia bacterium]
MDKKALLKKLKPLIIVAAVVLIVVIAVVNAIRIGLGEGRRASEVLPAQPDTEYPLAVYYVDVGQGDGIVIKCEDTVLVIDGGEREEADTMVRFLESVDADQIDCYIATHPHSDHIGAAAGIFAAMNVRAVMMTSFSEINMPTTKSFERLQTAIENRKSEVIFAEAGETYTFGPLTLEVFAPVEETADYNNMSIVFRLTYGKNTFMFTGDAALESEALMLYRGYDLRADVLKVAHHGSSSSTSRDFLEAVDPVLAVISCGKNNDNGHPHRETLALLNEEGIEYRRTDENGTVTVYGDGRNIFLKGD